jgi:hypothetical protein
MLTNAPAETIVPTAANAQPAVNAVATVKLKYRLKTPYHRGFAYFNIFLF